MEICLYSLNVQYFFADQVIDGILSDLLKELKFQLPRPGGKLAIRGRDFCKVTEKPRLNFQTPFFALPIPAAFEERHQAQDECQSSQHFRRT